MSLRPLKIIVQAVVIEENEDGKIVGERHSEPQTFYSPDDLKEWLDNFYSELNGKPEEPE
jgi:hypothetical protein